MLIIFSHTNPEGIKANFIFEIVEASRYNHQKMYFETYLTIVMWIILSKDNLEEIRSNQLLFSNMMRRNCILKCALAWVLLLILSHTNPEEIQYNQLLKLSDMATRKSISKHTLYGSMGLWHSVVYLRPGCSNNTTPFGYKAFRCPLQAATSYTSLISVTICSLIFFIW